MHLSGGDFYSLFSRRPSVLKKRVNIRGRVYPVTIQGTGKTPCICIGVGTLMQRTLSDQFFKTFQVISTDTYWIAKDRLSHPETLTMQDIVDDVLEVPRQLGLVEYILVGNSCFGIVAIEAAKRQPAGLKGVMAVAAPPRWDQKGIDASIQYFEKYASAERKANHVQRQEHFAKIKKPDESIVSVNAYEADAAKYFYNFNISRKEMEALWSGVEVDDSIMNHFFGYLLPNFDLSQGIEKVKVPVILQAGEFDFDSTPIHLWESFTHPPDFTILNCKQSGHWPQAESPEVFDQGSFEWMKTKL